jgi:ribosomal protein S18 acetylase RimI-like enzyme
MMPPAGRPYDPRGLAIRLAGPRAWSACLALDDGYTTSRMWQAVPRSLDDLAGGMPLTTSDSAADAPFSVTFQPLRLPRPVHEPGLYTVRPPAARVAAWEAAGCMLIVGPPPPDPAVEPGEDPDPEPPPPVVWGYMACNAVPGARLGWIAELTVAAEHRRRGLGRMLLDAARAWARASVAESGGGGLTALMMELSPRNYPGIAFCRREGFRFAGYTDYTLVGGDMRLFFIRPTD